MLHHVKELSPDQKRAIENLLGHTVSEDESVSIKIIGLSAIVAPQLSPADRKEALESLRRYFVKVDALRKPVNEKEEEGIINKALRSTRPNYRPVHRGLSLI